MGVSRNLMYDTVSLEVRELPHEFILQGIWRKCRLNRGCFQGRLVMKTVMCAGIAVLLMICSIDTHAAQTMSMKGRVIALDESGIMVKRGSREMSFVTDENIAIMAKMNEGSSARISAIELCQIVRVGYVKKDGKLIAVKVEILAESDCVIP